MIHTLQSPVWYDGNPCAAILGVHDWPQLPESHHTDGPKIRRFQGSCNTRVTAAQGSTRDQEEREIEGSSVPPALLLIHTPHSPGCYDGNPCAAILGVHDLPQLPESHHTDVATIPHSMEAATLGLLRRTDQQETKRKGRL